MNTLQTQVVGESCAEEIVLRLTPTNLPQLELKSRGVTHYKTVGWHQLLKMLDHSIVVEQLERPPVHRVSIPQLPEQAMLVTTEETISDVTVVVTGWVPGVEYPFVYRDLTYLIPIPNVVYRVRWSRAKTEITELSLAVTTDTVITSETRLFRWPFSNVYHDQRVCWTTRVTCELREVVERGVFGFMQTPNNIHLYGLGVSHNAPYREYHEFLRAVQDNQGVHADWLIPISKTVMDFHQS
ncbi:hypothetical protein LLE49_27245 [Alicyclobacillus tolerans]|uniref:hypothetical protein n=1 Tax=Alicyclobacillus tolerans TaxID=90970 RepID=UPI001F440AAD|nr:hypothetical protein [Alicyclobacillus tolerans]MCF8568418.1 hypothetical protein [Alicyclobacillus tolerans]